MWLFLGSECLFFGSLIAAYLLYRDKSVTGPYPEDLFDIPFTSVSAFILLMSSVTMVLALAAIQRGGQQGQPVRPHVLRAPGVSRRPRHRRRPDPAVAVRDGAAGKVDAGGELACGAGGAVLALRGYRLGRHIYPRLTTSTPTRAGAAMTLAEFRGIKAATGEGGRAAEPVHRQGA